MIGFSSTNRLDGDHSGDLGPARRLGVPHAPRPWTWLHQVHGAEVMIVTHPGEHAGADADAAVTATPGCTLAVRTADCAPVVLIGARCVGLAHAGWRGLAGGVLERAVAAMRDLDGGPIRAHIGPCIRSGCYEFAGPELDAMVERFGATVVGTTMWGTRSFDVPAAVAAALAAVGVTDVRDELGCTACDRRWYSHRARGEVERFATVAWLEDP